MLVSLWSSNVHLFKSFNFSSISWSSHACYFITNFLMDWKCDSLLDAREANDLQEQAQYIPIKSLNFWKVTLTCRKLKHNQRSNIYSCKIRHQNTCKLKDKQQKYSCQIKNIRSNFFNLRYFYMTTVYKKFPLAIWKLLRTNSVDKRILVQTNFMKMTIAMLTWLFSKSSTL